MAARDFGWAGTLDTIERLEATMTTMDRLERFRGHFFNWYDTQDLRALEPKYISSVDSGNLAGHLIALANACREMAAQPILSQNWTSGLGDVLELIREAVQPSGTDPRKKNAKVAKLNIALDEFKACIQTVPEDLAGLVHFLGDLSEKAKTIFVLAQANIEATQSDASEAVYLGIFSTSKCSKPSTRHRVPCALGQARFE